MNMKRFACISILLFNLTLTAHSQSIGGVINIYTPVLAFGCNSATVAGTAGFSIGDRVLLIQMKGATIDSSNSVAFGNILNYNDCGNYEIAVISSITGSTVFFQYQLLNSYTPSGRVQMIRIPQYTNVTVSSTLTCAPWNGSTGGVLIMEVSGTLTLNAGIDVSGKGFRGGTGCTNPDGGCGSGYPDYYYPVGSGFGAEKGEGISSISSARNGGRGALGNGGGGGNKHNSGGGGGGNYSMGGVGGNEANFCPPDPIGGIGGNNLNYALGKIFLGGGGGCSDNNDGVGTLGSNGGGIVIIRAGNITGNGNSIISDGIDVSYISNSIGDGAGGGGAGGTILLDVPAFTTLLNVVANGGRGGDQFTSYPACFGPGGGGGTGLIYSSLSSLPPNVTPSTQPGNAGVDLYASSSCYGTSYGAMPGQTATGLKYGLSVFEDDSLLSAPPVYVNLGNDTLLCGGSITLSAYVAGASYTWSTGASASSITVSASGTYWVTVATPGCTAVNDTISILNASMISASLGNDTTICAGDPLLLNAYNPGTDYLWSTGATSSSISVSSAGTYWVNVTSSARALSIYDTIIVSASTPVSLDLGDDTLLCSGTIVLDAGNPGAAYSWSTGETTQSVTVAAGVYWVNVQSGVCPAGDDTIFVFSPDMISVYLGEDATICSGDSLLLDAYDPGLSYTWSTGSTSSSVIAASSGMYWVNATSAACGISVYDTIIISIVSPPVASLGNDTVLCSGTMLLDAGNPGSFYLWSTGQNTETISVPQGTYWVTVGNTSCPPVSDTIRITFPGSIQGLGKDTSICTGPVVLDALNPGSSYLWSTGETSSTITAESPGAYWVSITDNCMQTLMDTIRVTGNPDESLLFLPNVFTPNHDNQNDVITLGRDDGPELTWKIYNRWGENICSQTGRKLSWDGSYKNEPLHDGTYFWLLEYDSYCTGSKERITKQGFIMLVK
jgi:gliding motility-associated-like protein